MMEWKPISTVPNEIKERETEICVWVGTSHYKGGYLQVSWNNLSGLSGWHDWEGDWWNPTHWLPITPPETTL